MRPTRSLSALVLLLLLSGQARADGADAEKSRRAEKIAGGVMLGCGAVLAGLSAAALGGAADSYTQRPNDLNKIGIGMGTVLTAVGLGVAITGVVFLVRGSKGSSSPRKLAWI